MPRRRTGSAHLVARRCLSMHATGGTGLHPLPVDPHIFSLMEGSHRCGYLCAGTSMRTFLGPVAWCEGGLKDVIACLSARGCDMLSGCALAWSSAYRTRREIVRLLWFL